MPGVNLLVRHLAIPWPSLFRTALEFSLKSDIRAENCAWVQIFCINLGFHSSDITENCYLTQKISASDNDAGGKNALF